jgi:hypothetical protein
MFQSIVLCFTEVYLDETDEETKNSFHNGFMVSGGGLFLIVNSKLFVGEKCFCNEIWVYFISSVR